MSTSSTTAMPWVEKYRPKSFNDIVLNDINKTICHNIIETGYFPHILLYGPPGTGKTTTINNLISKYQETNGGVNKNQVIQLNASDERGIDIIRNHILQFVNSKCMFSTGMKFVVLDEVDYMTKNAQHALRYLIDTYSTNTRFCLICNYISRIDEGLQTEFLKIRFNNLPKDHIYRFLSHITASENISITDKKIEDIQQIYGSDIRSMINFIQCNHMTDTTDIITIDDTVWIKLTQLLAKIIANDQKTYKPVYKYLIEIRRTYDMTFKNIIKDYFTYLIKSKKIQVTPAFLTFVERVVHSSDMNDHILINYVLGCFEEFLTIL
jgi:DNA polymerase III delta prime subunit